MVAGKGDSCWVTEPADTTQTNTRPAHRFTNKGVQDCLGGHHSTSPDVKGGG